MYGTANRRVTGVALEGRLGEAYNEEAFRYFLDLEHRRAVRAGLPVMLLLVDLREALGTRLRIEPVVASRLFSGLWLSVREADVVGWYREHRVIGAVLTQVEGGQPLAVTQVIRDRVSEALRRNLSVDVARRLRVRVYQLRAGVKG
jgi:hypothetical protein